MKYELIVQGILDIGEALLKSGAENFRIEESIERMCESYGCTRYDVFAIPSNIQLTVTAPDGQIITQIRHIEKSGLDFDKLDYMNDLCRRVCAETPNEVVLRQWFNEVMGRPGQSKFAQYFGGLLGGVGFGIFFGCNLQDAIVATVVTTLVIFMGNWLSKKESNTMIFNAVLSLVAEVLILAAAQAGWCTHPDRITLGVIMLLIGGIGITNGIRDIIQRDFISGSLQVMEAVLGAAGIVFGIAMPMFVMGHTEPEAMAINSSLAVQFISCTIACMGFAMWINIKGKQVLFNGLGAFITWGIYVLASNCIPSHFLCIMVAAVFVAIYAFVMARINKAPMTIFLTASAFPLIPGSNLYYMMFGCINADTALIMTEFLTVFSTCVAIAIGFNIIDVVARNVRSLASIKKA